MNSAGDDCFIIGRFINHEGQQKNQPSLRFGNIAQMPYEPIMRQTLDGRRVPQDSYLVEAHSISGYSGSPVFVHLAPGYLRPERPLLRSDVWHGPWLLGITWGYLQGQEVPVYNRDPASGRLTKSHMVAQTNSGMMGVVPAWKLDSLMRDPRLVRLRQSRYKEEMREREKSLVPLKTTSDLAPESEPLTKDDSPAHKENVERLLPAVTEAPRSSDET
jgi:hypothetical protein